MEHSTFLQDLSVVLLVAGFVTLLFQRLRLPVVLGYILAGFLIGPHTPPFPLVRSEETIKTLSELGVIFLMFSLGLEFSLGRLREVGLSAFLVAAIEIPCMIGLGYLLGRSFGWGNVDALFLGAVVSISSTTIILKVLKETHAARERFAAIILGVLIFEDILAILLLALLSTVASTGTLTLGAAAQSAWRLGVFLTVTFVVGALVIPKVLSWVSRFKNAETLLITALGLCFGVSYLASRFEYSVALGAFLVGAVMAGAKEARQIENLMAPLRDLFAAVFFVAVGMAIDPRVIGENAGLIAAMVLVVVLGKSVFASLGAFATGVPRSDSLRVGMGLAQIGEFSFIIAALGVSRGVVDAKLYPVAVSVSALTTLSTPFLMRHSPAVYEILDRVAPRRFLELCDSYSRSQARGSGVGGDVARETGVGGSADGRTATGAGAAPASLVAGGRNLITRPRVRGLVGRIAMNLFLLSALFLGAGAALEWTSEFSTGVPLLDEWRPTLAWACAMIVALPLQVGTVRRVYDLALETAEFLRESGQVSSPLFLGAFPSVITGLGLLALGVVNVALSSSLLPPLAVLLALGGVFVLVGVLLRDRAVEVYRKATDALEESVAGALGGHHDGDESASAYPGSAPSSRPHSAPPSAFARAGMSFLGSVLPSSAEIVTARVPIEGMPHVAGHFIRDTELRRRSGASIVCVERDGRALVNPDPDEALLEGDVVFLLGGPTQVDAARRWLETGSWA